MIRDDGSFIMQAQAADVLPNADDGTSGGNGDRRQLMPSAALSSSDIWHAATVSLTQQVFGPIRARADLRWALHVPGGFSPVRMAACLD